MLDVSAAPVWRPPAVMVGRQSELAWCADAFARRRVLAIYGLAGIGKTSLLLAAAHDQVQRTRATVAYHACAEGERIGDVLGALLAGDRPAVRRVASLRAALDAVVEWARRTPLALCIDDAHRLDEPLLLDVLAHLGAAPAPLWIALASRRQLPLPEADIDGAVLRLGPLSLDGARALWRDLEERFGPSIARFDALDGALRGIPFALRRAFATGQGDASGVDVSGLGQDQAALLAQLCAFRGPVDVARLRPLIPERMAALPALLQALLVEVTDTGRVAVHDLVRASVARSARPPTAAEHRVCLAFHEGDGDALARLHHTIGAEQWAAAVAQIDDLVKPQYGLFPLGGVVESQVRAAFDALERARVELPLSLRLARLQLSARHGEGRAALDALHSEAAREPAAWVHLATVELVLGDSVAAEAHVRQALADPSIAAGPIARAFLLALLLEVLRRQGQVEKLVDVTAELTAAAAQLGPLGAGVVQAALAA
ncbi:MAG TPA: ATP-binding protein, partial [Kofleriaceae bacterium]|nr:ATP-binding protein [Kofleriaceae bacterium]